MADLFIAKVPLWSGGEIVAHSVVDRCVAHVVLPYRWHLDSHGYAKRVTRAKEYVKPGFSVRHVFLHRLVLGAMDIDDLDVDHIDCDRLNNRRENLRLLTPALNRGVRKVRSLTVDEIEAAVGDAACCAIPPF